MQEILFRGKCINNNEWTCGTVEFHLIDGDLAQTKQETFITYDIMDKIGKVFRYRNEVIPETIGQYININDENGIKIFNDDVVEFTYFNCQYKAVVRFNKGCFELYWKGSMDESHSIHVRFAEHLKVIGNIHDNP